MAKNFTNFLILFLLTFIKNTIKCDGSKLMLQISPNLLDHPLFSYHVFVRCLVDQRGTVGDVLRYSSILRNIDAHTFIIDSGTKSVEQIIFKFDLLICTQFFVTIKAIKWDVAANDEFIKINLDNQLSESRSLIYNDKINTDEQSHDAELSIDLGKHFILKLSPVVKGNAFYEMEVWCHPKSKQLYFAKFKCANNGCDQIIFFRQKQCDYNEYDLMVWMWNSAKERKRMHGQPNERGLNISKILIVDGQELNIDYNGVNNNKSLIN